MDRPPPREPKEPGLCGLDSQDACCHPLSLPFHLIYFIRVASGKRAQPKAHGILCTERLRFQWNLIWPSGVCPHCLPGDGLQNFPTFNKLAVVSPNHPHPCRPDQEQIHHSPRAPPHPPAQTPTTEVGRAGHILGGAGPSGSRLN